MGVGDSDRKCVLDVEFQSEEHARSGDSIIGRFDRGRKRGQHFSRVPITGRQRVPV